MCDSKKVRQTMNIVFHEDGDVSPVDMPDSLNFTMSAIPTSADLPNHTFSAPTTHTPKIASKNKSPGMSGMMPKIVLGSATATPINAANCAYPMHAVLSIGPGLAKTTSLHGRARAKAFDNRTVNTALNSSYWVGGKYKKYNVTDLNYDLNKSVLIASLPVNAPPAVHATQLPEHMTPFDTTPLHDVPDYVNGMPKHENEWFSTDAIQAIKHVADVDPMMERLNVTVAVDFDCDDTAYFEFRPDYASQDTSDSKHCNWVGRHNVDSTFKLGTTDTVFMTHASLSKLDNCERKEDCLAAICSEYANFDKRCLWKLCRIPENAVTHNLMLLGKIKLLPSGVEEKVKFRAVMCGQNYVPGRDCGTNTYAPNAHITTARCLILDAVQNDKCLKSCDVKQAYTFAPADKRVFISTPPGRKHRYDSTTGERLGYEITGNIYGSPSGAVQWNTCCHNALIKHGCVQSIHDPSLYTKDSLRILLYTDDFLTSYPRACPVSQLEYDSFVNMLQTEFELGDDGHSDCANFIGMHLEFNFDRTSCVITQPGKIDELLAENGLLQCKPSYTPGIPNVLISSRDSPSPDDTEHIAFMADKPYKRRVGQLLHIARTSRPDICYQVNALARVNNNPGKLHWEASTHLLRYISHTREYGLVLKQADTGLQLRMWSDATWAPDYGTYYDNHRSTTGWTASGNNDGSNLLSWCSHRQSTIALSSCESETNAAVDAAQEAVYVRGLLADLDVPLPHRVPMSCDNQSAIKLSLSVSDARQSRHVGNKAAFIRQQVRNGHLTLEWVPSADEIADCQTKCLPLPQHELLRTRMGVLHRSSILPKFTHARRQ